MEGVGGLARWVRYITLRKCIFGTQQNLAGNAMKIAYIGFLRYFLPRLVLSSVWFSYWNRKIHRLRLVMINQNCILWYFTKFHILSIGDILKKINRKYRTEPWPLKFEYYKSDILRNFAFYQFVTFLKRSIENAELSYEL